MSPSSPRVGVWLAGGRGSVAVTTIVGAAALAAGLTEPLGCVTALPPLAAAGLVPYDDLVFGGHDIVGTPLADRAGQCAAAGTLPTWLLPDLAEAIQQADKDICCLQEQASAAKRLTALRRELAAFRDRHALEQVVVVNLASTEAPLRPDPSYEDPTTLRRALDSGEATLPDSSLTAFAALEEGCPYVNFTPSEGADLPALAELAEQRRLPYAGKDGKTGETLVKSLLAVLFAQRNLRVDSWSGINLLGGGDGAALSEPGPQAAKSGSKRAALPNILGYAPDGPVIIANVPELGDRKVAWDLIRFTGFLGVGAELEFTWRGIDSTLAAPLVLDLVRLTAAAHHAGRSGHLSELGFFFKDPGAGPHDLPTQFQQLTALAAELSGSPS